MVSRHQISFEQLPLFNRTQALAAAGGDLEVMREISCLFVADLPRRLRELREAHSQGSLARIATVAHSLRGSAAVFGSDAAVDATLRLEVLAKEGQRDALPPVIQEVESLFLELAELVASAFVHNQQPAHSG
ncbi:MAG: hypothetical protein KatS3mg077_1880 [Candidatus Binatia bacterium]|nr:MAG: hypothetical protein KatS3mg077_1880 [Candidatus Binatia bacterium]